MENRSLNYTANDSAALSFQLPAGSVAFAPFLFMELVAAVVSNAVLLALVILVCANKFNNNINIYLFSYALGGLIGVFDIFCLLVLVLARRWVFGGIVCSVTWYAMSTYNIVFLTIYLFISRDKLKAVKDPSQGRTSNKRAYIYSTVIWAVSIGTATLIAGWPGNFDGIPRPGVEDGNFICFGLSSERVRNRASFILTSFFVISFWVVSTIIIVTTFSNFVRILSELRELKQLRLHFVEQSRMGKVVRINGRDRPLYATGEERTAKSLTLTYFIQFVCVFISYAMFYIQIIRNFVLPLEAQDGTDFQIYFIVALMVQFFPCANPLFLILTNKRLRIRVRGLLKCTLRAEGDRSPGHRSVITTTTHTSDSHAQKIIHVPTIGESSKNKIQVFQDARSKVAPFTQR